MGLCRQTVIGQWCLRIEQYDITYDTIIRYIQTPFTVRQEQPLVSPFSFPFISFPPLLSVFLSLPLLLFSLTSSHLLLLLLPSSLSSSIGLSHRLDIRFFFLLFFLIIYLYFPPLPSFFVFIPVAFFSAWCCLILIFFFFFIIFISFFSVYLSVRGHFSS